MNPPHGEWPDEVEVQEVDLPEAPRQTDAGLPIVAGGGLPDAPQ